ncbi:hypothetical protein D3C77_394770 [compost metagenome]
MGEPVHLVDQHRVALLGNEQTLARRVVGQPLEAFITVQADTQGELLGILGIQKQSVVTQVDANQALLTLVRDHVTARPDILHRFGITKAGQRHTAQNTSVQRQLDQL